MRTQSVVIGWVLLVALGGCSVVTDPLALEAEAALKAASVSLESISTHGGYAGIYSADLTERYGEATYQPASPTQIWVQPPGTPSVGEAYLRAYRVTGERWYLQAAMAAGRALAWGQREVGGWSPLVDVAHTAEGGRMPVRRAGRGTFDDNITQGALSFLISLDEVVQAPWLTESIRLGLDYMLTAQFDNGAWPQRYPLSGGFSDYYTFNDNAINDCIAVMLRAHAASGNERYLRSARAGGDFIILSQGRPPQAGWAQQYSHDLKPAWGRPFEPPGICSAVTGRNIRTLVELYLYTRDEKYLQPIPAAIAWLERSQIGPNRWARVYEVSTNRPVYGDRGVPGRTVHYDYSKISEAERKSYRWQGDYGIAEAIARYAEVRSLGAQRFLAKENRPLTEIQRRRKAIALRPRVQRIVAALDEQGRWLEANRITTRRFVTNANILCDYLELVSRQ